MRRCNDVYEIVTVYYPTSCVNTTRTTTSTSTTLVPTTTTTSTIRCRPLDLLTGNVIISMRPNSNTINWNWKNVSVPYACEAFNYLKDVYDSQVGGGIIGYNTMQYSQLQIGEILYYETGTDCNVIQNGFYWFQPNNIVNKLGYFYNLSQINIVTVLDGIITAIDICDYIPTTTSTTTLPPTTTTTSSSTSTSTTSTSSSTSTSTSTSTTSTTTTAIPTTTTTSSSTTTTTTTLAPTTTTTTVNPCPDCISGTEVTIGTQIWTGCNLDVTTYANGDPIPEVTDPTAWTALTTGAWCYYNNNSTYGPTYGKIYNWYAVNDSRGLAPIGYHVPTSTEWTTLRSYLGGNSISGGKLKETGFCHWQSPNIGATNETGFTALGAGYRVGNLFSLLGSSAYWWTATEISAGFSSGVSVSTTSAETEGAMLDKKDGYSVRLIKD